jgi:hypothetical protein
MTQITTKQLRAKYDELEDNNDHNEAAKLLVDQFGTEEERAIIEGITVRHNRRGYITDEDRTLRYKTSQKYFHLLKAIS